MDKKILLINPPLKYRRMRQILPLGLLNLGTILRKHGFEIEIVDITAEKPYDSRFTSDSLTPKEFLQKFKKSNPDIVGLTSVTENYPIAMKIARMCKKENNDLKIMFGGIHATFQATECLNNNPFIDIVALGEAEHIIIDIVKGLMGKIELKEVNNIIFKENGLIKYSQIHLVNDLNKIPLPDLEFIKDKFYPSYSLQVEFSRGCPFQCAFCSLSPFIEKKVRYFPTKHVVDLLEAYQDLFNNFSFSINDPLFLLNYKKVELFLNEVQNRKMELKNWGFQTRVDTINRAILRKLKKFDANLISLGIEDIHNSVLQKIGKQQNFNQIKNAVKVLKDLNFTVRSNFIIGLPFQTKEQMLENIDYANQLDLFHFPCLAPFPGSPLFSTPEKFGLTILSKDWELYTFREIVTDSMVFPIAQQKEIREIAWHKMAQLYLGKDSTFYHQRKELQHLLEIGFETWNEEWKQENLTGWN
ncbi:MAG: B12-binding domain-containing radical SAM protein [Promethearchaeota archaeon]